MSFYCSIWELSVTGWVTLTTVTVTHSLSFFKNNSIVFHCLPGRGTVALNLTSLQEVLLFPHFKIKERRLQQERLKLKYFTSCGGARIQMFESVLLPLTCCTSQGWLFQNIEAGVGHWWDRMFSNKKLIFVNLMKNLKKLIQTHWNIPFYVVFVKKKILSYITEDGFIKGHWGW